MLFKIPSKLEKIWSQFIETQFNLQIFGALKRKEKKNLFS